MSASLLFFASGDKHVFISHACEARRPGVLTGVGCGILWAQLINYGEQREIELENPNGSNAGIKVLFLGQCLQYGYQGVDKSATFASLVPSMLRARFPGLHFQFETKFLYHPRGLKTILRHRLVVSRPDVAVITLPAMFAATSWRVNIIYEMAPEIIDTARSLLQKIESRLKGNTGLPDRTTMLDKAFALRPPLSIPEYETLVQEAVQACQRTSSCRFVLMGPGGFNEDTIEDYAVHSPEVWASVNQMVLRIGRRLKVAVIDSQEALSEYGGEVFIPNNHRWSLCGHEVVAREVESVLASQVVELNRS